MISFSGALIGTSSMTVTKAPVNNSAPNSSEYTKSLETRNKSLVQLLEQRSAEIRALKYRMSNLISGKKPLQMNGADAAEVSWSDSELCRAFVMQKLSKPLYNFVREKFTVPLPKGNAISNFVQNMNLVRGIQKTMINLLENDGDTMATYEKLTVLQISMIKTKEIYEYNEHTDNIWGPHKYIIAVVANGLYREWNQLVYLNFDVRVNKSTINNIIETLHKIDFQVVGCTCNFEEEQPNIWTELDVSYGKNYFAHPVTGTPIYAFYFIDDLLAATNKHFIEGNLAVDGLQLSKDALMQIIQRIFRKVAIDKELLEWADADCRNISAIRKFFSQYTINLLRISSPDDKAAKSTAEFINIIKSFTDIMNKRQILNTETGNVNFETYLDYQNKRVDKVHARLFKIQCNSADQSNKKFREAIMMTIVSLKMLQTSILDKYKYASFCTHIITNEFLKRKVVEICDSYNFDPILPPVQTFRIFKDIFLHENCSVKLESDQKFFYDGPIAADGGKRESDYVLLLIEWIMDNYKKKNPNKQEQIDVRRKLDTMEEMFQIRQNPNFRIREGVIGRITKKLVAHGFSVVPELIQTFVLQRHMLRIKYLNENRLLAIPGDVRNENTSIIATITLDE